MSELDDLYRRIDVLLEERVRVYPARPEPFFSTLLAALGELADRLREQAGDGEPEAPPAALAASPVFVLGYYRSGTSLLLSLLSGHPELVELPGESRHFNRVAPRLATLSEAEGLRVFHHAWIRRLVTPYGLPPHWVLGRPWEGGPDRYLEFTRRLLAYAEGRPVGQDLLGVVAAALAAVQPGTQRLWVEKTPRNEEYLPRIRAAYPQARFLHIVRDPRAVVASIRKFNESGQYLASAPQAAMELRSSLGHAVRSAGEDTLLVKYEELVAGPEREMRRVAAFLGVAWDEVLLSTTATANSSSADRRVAGAVHDLSAGRAAELSWWPAAFVRAFAGEPARALGYDVPRAGRALTLAARGWLALTFRVQSRWRLRALSPSRPS